MPIGFLICYEDNYNKVIRSWVCAVNPDHRNKGVASKMLSSQEKCAKKRKVRYIKLDMTSKRIEMLILCLKKGFFISGIEYCKNLLNSRIFLEKKL
jgi:GNAT superfamily N-acetyltransferase